MYSFLVSEYSYDQTKDPRSGQTATGIQRPHANFSWEYTLVTKGEMARCGQDGILSYHNTRSTAMRRNQVFNDSTKF